MYADSPVVSAPAVKVWPPPLTLRSRSTSGSASWPRLWNGPRELDRDRLVELCRGAAALELRGHAHVELAAVDVLRLLNVSLMTAVASSSLPPPSPPHAARPSTARSSATGRARRYERLRRGNKGSSLVRRPLGLRLRVHRTLQSALGRRLAGNIQKVLPACANRYVAAAARRRRPRAARGRAGRAAAKDPVRTTITRAFERGTIDEAQRSSYLSTYSAALRTRKFLSGVAARRADIRDRHRAAVREAAAPHRAARADVPDPAAQPRLVGKGGATRFGRAAAARRQPRDLPVLPGHGLQLHPLANFGKLNGYWQGKRNADLRSLADDLVELAVERNGFLDLGVLLRLRRRLAAVDLRHGAGHRDAGAGAGQQPPRRTPRCSRSPRAPAAPSTATPRRRARAAERRRLVRAV